MNAIRPPSCAAEILILSGYLAKVLYEVAATPVTYWIVNSLRRREGVDVYDRDADFNPFHGAG